MASLSAVFFRPVIYCNVLIDVYLCSPLSATRSLCLMSSLAEQFPRLQLHIENYTWALLFVLVLGVFFLISCLTIQFSLHTQGELQNAVEIVKVSNVYLIGSCWFSGLSQILPSPTILSKKKKKKSLDNSTFCHYRSERWKSFQLNLKTFLYSNNPALLLTSVSFINASHWPPCKNHAKHTNNVAATAHHGLKR